MDKTLKIKVCGMKEAQNITSVAELGIDLMGFIFYDESKRNALELDPEALDDLPEDLLRVGVFVNESFNNIIDKVDEYGLDYVQLHGDESSELCESLREYVGVIKVFSVDESFDFEVLNDYQEYVDFFLFDTKGEHRGGNGYAFHWKVLSNYKFEVPFLLSGGLSPENIDSVKELNHPYLYGLDLNSRFETEPGLKDVSKLERIGIREFNKRQD